MATRVSMEGLVEIASHEGIVNAPYKDSVGVWTVGIGHTANAGPPDPAVKRGEYSITEIMDIFAADIRRFEARVRKAFTVPLSQSQFDAAVSFDYNTGGIDSATWVKKFNAGDVDGARKSFMNWSKPAEIIPRRRKERALFFSGVYSNDGMATLWPANTAGQVLWSRGQRVDIRKLMNEDNAPEKPDAPVVPDPCAGIPVPDRPSGSGAKPVGIGAALVVAAGALWAKWEAFTTWIGSFF